MAIKRKGIIARPGKYTYKDGVVEVKTAEELRAAVTRQPIIPLTFGHPPDGVPRARDFIGTVSQKWNEEKQRVDGDFWFYDETPQEILDRVVNGWPTKISAGFTVDSVENDAQKGIFYTHVAVLKDEDDPACPLGQCGVNVRMESNSDTDYRYEQAADADEKKDDVKTPPVTNESVILSQEQMADLADMIAERLRPKEEEKKEEQKAPVVEEHEEQIQPQVQERRTPEPVRTVPASVPQENDGFEIDPVTGGIVFKSRYDRSKKKK